MPKKRVSKQTKTKVTTKVVAKETPKDFITSTLSGIKIPNLQNWQESKKTYLVILILGLLLLAFYKKDWFVAATVNNQPISAIELNQRMSKQYKSQVLNQMINEKILLQEAAKKGITVSQAELDDKVKSTETQYGGADAFNSILTQQGITREDFINQTRIQIMVDKLYGSEATASAEEIDKFMTDNKDLPEATNEAKFKTLAEEQTKQQKLSQIFSEKFQALKQAAKINIF